VLPFGLGMLVHVLIRRFAAKGGTLLSPVSKSHVELPPRKRNRSESSVLSWGQEFPPNACRGERRVVWERAAPGKPVRPPTGILVRGLIAERAVRTTCSLSPHTMRSLGPVESSSSERASRHGG
jgi:hypothetical protein